MSNEKYSVIIPPTRLLTEEVVLILEKYDDI